MIEGGQPGHQEKIDKIFFGWGTFQPFLVSNKM
jgi:hypothetical protein